MNDKTIIEFGFVSLVSRKVCNNLLEASDDTQPHPVIVHDDDATDDNEESSLNLTITNLLSRSCKLVRM